MSMNLIDYISTKRIKFMESTTKEAAIEELVAVSAADGKVENPAKLKDDLLKREAIVSTGIGFGVAIPHAKVPEIAEFFITIGIHKAGIDWESLDSKPAQIIFLIAGPDNMQEKYLRLLAKLTLIIKNPERRQKIIECTTAEEVFNIFKGL